jgi:plasmid stabilization system protein ParE
LTRYKIVFTPEAETQLVDIFRYIASAASPEIAARFTNNIVTHCESLRTFPFRGTKRDDIRLGLRTVTYRKRVVIAFDIEANLVTIIGVFYAGQDYESALKEG